MTDDFEDNLTQHMPPGPFDQQNYHHYVLANGNKTFSSYEDIMLHYEGMIKKLQLCAYQALIGKRECGFYDCYGEHADALREILVNQDFERWKHILPPHATKEEIDG